VNVPPAYDPARRYQVRFHLHGGVGARETNQPRGTGEIGALAGAEQIYVIPTSWNAAHPSRGCSQDGLKSTGGDGLIYCFAAR